MASRILGMGDVVTLVERAAEKIDEEEAARLQEKLRKSQFDFDDFLSQLRQIGEMGGMESVLKLLPGGRNLAGMMSNMDPKYFTHMEAIVLSMTKEERRNPDILDFSRRKRIAKGSGTSLEKVSQLIKQFSEMRKMMKKSGILGRFFGGGGGGGGEQNNAALLNSLSGSGYTGLGLSKDEKDRRRKLEKQKKKQRAKQRKKK